MKTITAESLVHLQLGPIVLNGDWRIPPQARGVVLFAHGSGSSRHSPRNRYVAEVLNRTGLATLLFDLLTVQEEKIDAVTGELRFDIPFLSRRLIDVTDWLIKQSPSKGMKLGYFGASTGAGAALLAATKRPEIVKAIVSRGGRPDMAMEALPRVKAPTLLIVGEHDREVLDLNQQALERIGTQDKKLEIVPGATHLFEEPGTLEKVADLAAAWFQRHLANSEKKRRVS